ncbi:hypothetical protein C8J57DRAFT_1480055 [Mycena rebaudengoi]|nr:hypothetical protein C8J57DRAFT_1480055 [Mycena rebaudengoi]
MKRKARVEALMRLRSAPKRPGVVYFGTAGLDMGPKKSDAQKQREAADLALKAEDDSLRKARLAHLVILRAATRRRYGCFLLKPKANLFSEIALHAPNDTLLQLFYLSRASKRIARVVLYKNIAITKKGPLLVRTLASDRSLPPMFLPEERGQIRVNGLEWEWVLQQMSNLKFLTICDYIELTPAALQGITFQLKSFYSCDALVAPWTQLLQNQTAVEELNIHGDIEGAVPLLPALINVTRVLGGMHPSVIDTLGHVNATLLQTLRLRCPDFLFISHLPNLLPALRHLILDDDVTWQMTDRKYPRTLRSAS